MIENMEYREITNPIQIYVLERLRNDMTFTPASGSEMVCYKLNGKEIRAHTSYYMQLVTGDNVLIRAAEHGTSLDRWLGRRNNPQKSLQNASIVFTEKVPSSNINSSVDTFFIVEQYYYIVHSITEKDVDKIINQIKSIQSSKDAEKVFIDPLRKNSKKKAGVQILRPYNNNAPVVPPTKGLNQRQLDIANGTIKLDEEELNQLIEQNLRRILSKLK